MTTPYISIRKHYRLVRNKHYNIPNPNDQPGGAEQTIQIPGNSSEPTSTLVLTSHTSRFVDIRIYKTSHESTSRGGLDDLPRDGGQMERLQWAFAGTLKTTKPTPKPKGKSDNDNDNNIDAPDSHNVWTHWIDSSEKDPDQVDEGDMYNLPNGDVLERGENVDSETGKVQIYEELWRDLDVETIPGEGRRVCTVLQVENAEEGIRGLIIRVGGYAEGLMSERGKGVTAERWQWFDSEASNQLGDGYGRAANEMGEYGGWVRTARLGDGAMPCTKLFVDSDVVREGEIIRFGRLDWRVVEKYSW